jgi:hypothetical protein
LLILAPFVRKLTAGLTEPWKVPNAGLQHLSRASSCIPWFTAFRLVVWFGFIERPWLMCSELSYITSLQVEYLKGSFNYNGSLGPIAQLVRAEDS